jgi:hypothetical protein
LLPICVSHLRTPNDLPFADALPALCACGEQGIQECHHAPFVNETGHTLDGA